MPGPFECVLFAPAVSSCVILKLVGAWLILPAFRYGSPYGLMRMVFTSKVWKCSGAFPSITGSVSVTFSSISVR